MVGRARSYAGSPMARGRRRQLGGKLHGREWGGRIDRRTRRHVARSPTFARPARRQDCVQGLSEAAARDRLGGLRQGAVRRVQASVALFVALHPPHRDLQSPADVRRPQRRHLQIQGLSDRKASPLQNDDVDQRCLLCALPHQVHVISGPAVLKCYVAALGPAEPACQWRDASSDATIDTARSARGACRQIA